MGNNENRFRSLVDQMANLYAAKNADYGNSFSQSVQEFGYVAGIVRMSDKFNRLKNLALGKASSRVKEESLIDTLLDLASYSVMLAMEVEKTQK